MESRHFVWTVRSDIGMVGTDSKKSHGKMGGKKELNSLNTIFGKYMFPNNCRNRSKVNMFISLIFEEKKKLKINVVSPLNQIT